MAKEPISIGPPASVWLAHTEGLYAMPRTTSGDPKAVEYVRADDHQECLAYIERMVGQHVTDPVSAIVELRFALGDNGKRSIPEFIEYARQLAATQQDTTHDHQ